MDMESILLVVDGSGVGNRWRGEGIKKYKLVGTK